APPPARHKPAKLESRRPPAWPRRSHRSPTIQSDSLPPSELVGNAEATLPRSAVSSRSQLGATAATRRGSSVRFTDEISTVERRPIVIPALAGSLRQLHFRAPNFLVGNRSQDVRDAIEPRPPLVVGPHDVPRCVLAVRRLQHHVARARVVVPAPVRFEVHWTQLPLPERVGDASGKPPFLLILSDLQPAFDHDNTGIDDVFFHFRAKLEKMADLLRGAKSHHRSDAGAVVPAAVEDHDLAPRRKALDIALHEHLALFAIRGSGKSHHAKHARAHPLGDGLDRSALAGGIAPLEHDDDARSRGLDPILQMAKLDLGLAQFLLVSLALHLLLAIAACRPFQCHDITRLLPAGVAHLMRCAFFGCRFEPTHASP